MSRNTETSSEETPSRKQSSASSSSESIEKRYQTLPAFKSTIFRTTLPANLYVKPEVWRTVEYYEPGFGVLTVLRLKIPFCANLGSILEKQNFFVENVPLCNFKKSKRVRKYDDIVNVMNCDLLNCTFSVCLLFYWGRSQA